MRTQFFPTNDTIYYSPLGVQSQKNTPPYWMNNAPCTDSISLWINPGNTEETPTHITTNLEELTALLKKQPKAEKIFVSSTQHIDIEDLQDYGSDIVLKNNNAIKHYDGTPNFVWIKEKTKPSQNKTYSSSSYWDSGDYYENEWDFQTETSLTTPTKNTISYEEIINEELSYGIHKHYPQLISDILREFSKTHTKHNTFTLDTVKSHRTPKNTSSISENFKQHRIKTLDAVKDFLGSNTQSMSMVLSSPMPLDQDDKESIIENTLKNNAYSHFWLLTEPEFITLYIEKETKNKEKISYFEIQFPIKNNQIDKNYTYTIHKPKKPYTDYAWDNDPTLKLTEQESAILSHWVNTHQSSDSYYYTLGSLKNAHEIDYQTEFTPETLIEEEDIDRISGAFAMLGLLTPKGATSSETHQYLLSLHKNQKLTFDRLCILENNTVEIIQDDKNKTYSI